MENETQQTETSTMPVTTRTVRTLSSGRQLLRQSFSFTITHFWSLFWVTLLSGLVALPGIILAFYLETKTDASLATQYGLAILVTILSIVGSIISVTMATRATMHGGEWRLSAILGSLGQLWWPLTITIFFTYAVMGAGLIFFVIPGIAFSVFLLPIMWVVAAEGLRGRTALVRSINLVSGRWWAVFGRLLFLGLMCLLAGLLGLLAIFLLSPVVFFFFMINEIVAYALVGVGALFVYLAVVTGVTFVMMRYSWLLYEDLITFSAEEKKPSRWGTWPLSVLLVVGTVVGILYLIALPYLTLEDMRTNDYEPASLKTAVTDLLQ